ncbi:hypothetical protein TVAG_191620 [Trichomonas vaginalis G3]|uniref:Uncharacterized protein n=1 Tax=Trichomonas vaginalis (strain ATCC PRA-98 / G3) TaxID=412133 RepID=A2EQL8_TRIV3|nr:hypothetical protein TVAGG3_0976810 [Trichomonas vaginalis G3]EAY05065.1 hypothetical protein TVAG_191620 [Trichomonas vaginalis G3]KAI5488997.1 hypothetical protein TVAGG3_0976810 [Trichomonas vaginalis G3]|eukprot:XP_001317288.1 hypothetical protein [Trichomonas vaginalis G3]
MFSYFIFLTSETTFASPGYYALNFKKGESFNVDTLDKNAVFYLDQISKFDIVQGKDTLQPPTNQSIWIISQDHYVVKVKSLVTIKFWIISQKFCKNNNYFIQTSNSLGTQLNLTEPNTSYCFFFQNNFNEAKADTLLLSSNNLTKSEYHESLLPDEPKITCPFAKKCLFTTNVPFFFRVENLNKSQLSLKFAATNVLSNTTTCSVEDLLNNSTIPCKCNIMFDDISVIGYILLGSFFALLFIYVIAFLLKPTLCPTQTKIDFSQLKNKPFAGEITRDTKPVPPQENEEV